MWLGATTDPKVLVPGSVAAIDAAIASWKSRASTAETTASSLRRIPSPEGWTGAAASAYEGRVQKVVAPWARLQEAFTEAAAALQEYASTLEWAQDQAQVAIQMWEAGEAADAAVPLLQPNLTSRVAVTPTSSNPGAPMRAEARQILDDARAELSAAGDRAAAVIRTAAEQPDLRPGTWAAVGNIVSTPADALAFVSGLSGPELDAVLDARPDVASLLAKAEPAAVNAWWEGLSGAQATALIASLPAVIGNLEGVAYGARDKANQMVLDDRLKDAEAALARAEEPLPWFPPPSEGQTLAHSLRVAEAREQLEALEGIDAALAVTGGEPRYLVSLSVDTPPLAAVSIGNLDTADNVTYAVPGMGSSAAGLDQWADSAENLRAQQQILDPSREHAVVAWIGYEAPPKPLTAMEGNFEVLGTDYAEAGARKLGLSLEGFEATRSDASLNVVGHSYGTTTASIALAQTEVPVDTFVSVGSAGLPTNIDHASDLNVGAVYAGQAADVIPFSGEVPLLDKVIKVEGEGDQWAWTGRVGGNHPVNPVSQDFGAHTFGTDSAGSGLTPVSDHGTETENGGGYLDFDTESLLNIGRATTGLGEQVTPYVPYVPLVSEAGRQ